MNALATVAEAVVSERAGIVHALEALPTRAGSPKFFHYTARLSNLVGCGFQPVASRLDGASADRETAVAKAMSEALRYYCAAFYDPDDLPFGCAPDFAFESFPGDRFTLFSPEQYLEPEFPYVPLTPDTPVEWAPAVEFTTGKTFYVPASFVRTPYRVKSWNGELAVAPATSVGLAAGTGFADAALQALCGVIEADALAVIWQAGVIPPQVRIETLSDRNYEVVSRFEKSLGTITLLNADVGLGIPSILASFRATAPRAPALVFAAGTNPDAEIAVTLALDNLALALRYAIEIKSHMPPLEGGAARVVTAADHLNYWGDVANSLEAAFLFSSKRRIEVGELPRTKSANKLALLKDVVGRVAKEGNPVLFADLTTRDVRETGISVVRAIVPGFQPLFAGYRHRALDRSRLATMEQRFAQSRVANFNGDNPAPHPFLIGGADA